MSTLEDMKARLAAATPGPWFLDAGGDSGVYTEARPSPTSSDVASAFMAEDEALIANAPTDIARLIAALEAVEELAATLGAKPEHRSVAARIRNTINEALEQS